LPDRAKQNLVKSFLQNFVIADCCSIDAPAADRLYLLVLAANATTTFSSNCIFPPRERQEGIQHA
jgi:hypothetical protein